MCSESSVLTRGSPRRSRTAKASSPHVKLIGDFGSAIEVITNSAIASRFGFFAKIRSPATFDFCNTIGQTPTFVIAMC